LQPTIRLRITAFAAALLVSACAASPSAQKNPNDAARGSQTPRWVTDSAAAFPDSEWLSVVDSAKDKKSAESAAISGLAQVFRVDLVSVINANQQFAQALNAANGEKTAVSSESRDFAQELTSSSNVSGLIGVQTDSWTAKDGTVYANARMNRRECSARYTAMIHENERIIKHLKEEAALQPETFDAFELLELAVNVARVTDNLHSLLSVLDPSAISRRPEYGNAEAVKTIALNAARSIVITIQVTGDSSGRIARAFGGYFTSRGFRVNTSGANPYLLSASFALEDVIFANSDNKYVRYILNCSVKNKDGVEIVSSSENSREGHVTVEEARQRALRRAETSIATTGFAAHFDAYLVSLIQ
jgi:hypothetical protein